MSHLVDLLDGMLASADERLAPPGLDMPEHLLHVAAALGEAEQALAALHHEPSPFESMDAARRASDASFAVVEAAAAYWGLAVRLRSRFTGLHAKRAGESLRRGLLVLAERADDPADTNELLGRAGRALGFVAPAVRAAARAEQMRGVGTGADQAIQRFVTVGVLSLLRVATTVQEDGELR